MTDISNKIPLSFFEDKDVLALARSLLGKSIFTVIDGKLTGGIITETEAYAGIIDKASHAYGGRRTKRTETMYKPGGYSYVYFTYGMHHLFNIVTSRKDDPQAILIRGIVPTEGLDIQLERRNYIKNKFHIANGPAKVCQALGITLEQNNIPLSGDVIWLQNGELNTEKNIITCPRVGVDYAGEDALLPYRFILSHPDYKSAKNPLI
ncbi:MAG: DNA-3-methyladenine glycosylase [Bacteroidales bacterium]|nr:DNA-3-methyladenine glycosylase [Bacteroidales bacterium]